MQISYLNGTRLQRALMTGARYITAGQDYLNEINVFPVPDGDTGSNMALTMNMIADAVESLDKPTLRELLDCVADAAFNGARGSSGTILAQFFQGFSEGSEDRTKLSTADFASVMSIASDYAYDAIANPREGTIITVMREWSNYLVAEQDKHSDFLSLLDASLIKANQALKATTEQMDVLKEAHVVDSGAQGFVIMLEGIVNFVNTGELPPEPKPTLTYVDGYDPNTLKADSAEDAEKVEQEHHDLASIDLSNQYCTECIIEGKDLKPGLVKKELGSWGNALITLGNSKHIKIHIHTNDPKRVFEKMAQFGEIKKTKHEDMWAQYRQYKHLAEHKEIGLITDTSCDLPDEYLARHNIVRIPLQVIFGQETFLDTINLTRNEFYNKLEATEHAVKTSQAFPADYLNKYEMIAEQGYKQGLAILLSRELSGTVERGELTAKQFDKMPITVIDSQSTSGSLGLVLQIAAEAVAEKCPLEEVIRRVNYAAKQSWTYVSPKSLEYLIKGGRINKAVGSIATSIHILPIIAVNSEGIVTREAVTFGIKANRHKVIELAKQKSQQLIKPRFIISHANAEDEAHALSKKLMQRLQLTANIQIVSVAAAIGAHSGPGTVAISVFGFKDEADVF